jgi:tetratricopeptide (TPR) repeat protein
VRYLRLVVEGEDPLGAAALAVVVAVEVAWPAHAQRDPQALWAVCASLFSDALVRRSRPSGTLVIAWPAEDPEAVVRAAARALELRERISDAELRSGVALGIVGGGEDGSAVERCAEQLALAAGAGQTLLLGEAARRLCGRFELSGGGALPRWPIDVPPNTRWLVGRRAAIRLPSAVNGEPPTVVIGRVREQQQLRDEFATVTGARKRRVVLVTAPAGGGKSYLLRHGLAASELRVAGGVAFAPLGERSLDLLAALATDLGAESLDGDDSEEAIAMHLAQAACASAREVPSAVVIDDLHWAHADALRALASAIDRSSADVPLAWVLSTRAAAVANLAEVSGVIDTVIGLDPLSGGQRVALLETRLEEVTEELRDHVVCGEERGNPLYLEHLAAAVGEDRSLALPATLHEAVLARLDHLAGQAEALTSWPAWSVDRRGRLEALERELEDWLDRLETNDIAELSTIGRYLARLRGVDVTLVVARSLLGMPVRTSRRLAHAIERLSAASVDAHLAYLATIALDGHLSQAAAAARVAAEQAQRELRLCDAERMVAFACQQQPHDHTLLRLHGDLSLALGRPLEAISHYHAAAQLTSTVELERRTARAEATAGRLDAAIERLTRAARDGNDTQAAGAVMLDLARLRGETPPAAPPALVRQWARARAWAHPDAERCREAIALLTLDGTALASAAELVETAALARVAGLAVAGLAAVAHHAATALRNPLAVAMLANADPAVAGKVFLHWCT